MKIREGRAKDPNLFGASLDENKPSTGKCNPKKRTPKGQHGPYATARIAHEKRVAMWQVWNAKRQAKGKATLTFGQWIERERANGRYHNEGV